MKAKYLFSATLCCIALIACQGNDPNNENNKPSTEVIERLSDLVDGIGTIIDSKTLEDGSIVMTDDKGNTITKDKDGNITIITKDGETILIDNSIKEDSSTPKDKWYNTKWQQGSYGISSPDIDLDDRKEQFVQTLREYGFIVEEHDITKDSTVIEIEENEEYSLQLRNTTATMQQMVTSTKYTYSRTYQFTWYDVIQETVGEGEIRYRFAIEYDEEFSHYDANLYEDYYYYAHETGSFILYESRQIDGLTIGNDNVICVDKGYQNKDTKEELLSKNTTSTLYNYRRLSDTQLAASNNSASYILREDTENDTPELKVYDLDGNHLITFYLVSF